MAYGEPDAIHPADLGREGMRSMAYRMNRQAWGKGVAREFVGDYHEYCRRLAKEARKPPKRKKPSKNARRRLRIFERDNWECVVCGLVGDERVLTLDHIRPVAHGGSNSPKNLQTMCVPCNNEKGNEWDGKSGYPKPEESIASGLRVSASA